MSIDSTGLESGHASLHYRYQRARDPGVSVRMPDFPKVTWALDNDSYLILGDCIGRGPGYDAPTLAPAVRAAVQHVKPALLLADSGFDSEANHRIAREECGIGRSVIALNNRGHSGPPKTRFRREMQRCPRQRAYRQRSHVESGVSQHKRRLGSELKARIPVAQAHECRLRHIVHNLALLA